jgi:2,3,4,5-tetrahydropyridine-2-carboxylate N-succinyltransferase
VIVEENSVIASGVNLSSSTKIYNRETDEIMYGKVPKGSVVVPGNLPSKIGNCYTYCAVIAKTVDQQTLSKVAINDILREV